MNRQRKSRTNVPSISSASSSSQSEEDKKMVVVFNKGELEKAKEEVKNALKIQRIDFHLWKLSEGTYLTIPGFKYSNPKNIGKVIEKGKLVAENVVHELTGFYYPLDYEWTQIVKDYIDEGRDIDAYIVDADQSTMKLSKVENGIARTEIKNKNNGQNIMVVTNKNIEYVNESDPAIKKVENADENEIKKLGKNQEDFLWYVIIATPPRTSTGEREYLKYFKISSYQRKWENSAKNLSNLIAKPEVIVYRVSQNYKTFLTDLDYMKENRKLEQFMKRANNNILELPQKFKMFINLLINLTQNADEQMHLIYLGKTLYQICEIYRSSISDAKLTTLRSIMNIESFLTADDVFNNYKAIAEDYKNSEGKDLYEQAKKVAIGIGSKIKEVESKSEEEI
jgi:hypothetical protein